MRNIKFSKCSRKMAGYESCCHKTADIRRNMMKEKIHRINLRKQLFKQGGLKGIDEWFNPGRSPLKLSEASVLPRTVGLFSFFDFFCLRFLTAPFHLFIIFLWFIAISVVSLSFWHTWIFVLLCVFFLNGTSPDTFFMGSF